MHYDGSYKKLKNDYLLDEFSSSDDEVSSKFMNGSKAEEKISFLDSSQEKLVSKTVKLKRNVGVCGGVSVVVGSMIGSGIFIIPTGVLKHCNGDMSLSMIIWVLGGVVATLVALCFCELSTLIPESGGMAPYIKTIYGSGACFVFLWIFLLTAIPQAAAIQIIALGDYISEAIAVSLGLCAEDLPASLSKFIGFGFTFLILACNMTNVKLAVKLQLFCTIGKVGALIIIAFVGIMVAISDSSTLLENFRHSQMSNEEAAARSFNSSVKDVLLASVRASPGIEGLSLAIFQALWAYDGFDNITCITEEVKNPKKTLPLIIIVSLFSVMALYLIVNFSYFAVLTEREMLNTDAVAVSFAAKVHPWLTYVVTLGVCLSLVGSINVTLLASGRMPFVAGRLGFMPEVLSMIHVQHFSPVPALLFLTCLAGVMILPSNISMLLKAAIFTIWACRAFCAAGVLILRRKLKHVARPYKVYKLTAVLAVVACTYLVMVPLIFKPQALYALTFGLIIFFAMLYRLMKSSYFSMAGVGKFTVLLQKMLLVAPSIDDVRSPSKVK